RGVEMEPSAMRYAGVIERLSALNDDIKDLGDVTITHPNQADNKGELSNLKNLREVTKANEQLAQMVDEQVGQASFPLILGGDHSIAIGSLAGISKHYKNLRVIWYDAHGDLNTEETSPSGNIHGMPLAASLGL